MHDFSIWDKSCNSVHVLRGLVEVESIASSPKLYEDAHDARARYSHFLFFAHTDCFGQEDEPGHMHYIDFLGFKGYIK